MADQTVTTDEHGHALQRLPSSNAEAAVEVETSDYTVTKAGDKMRLKVGFWPALAVGEAAAPDAAVRASALIELNHTFEMTLLNSRGATIVRLRPELNPAKAPPPSHAAHKPTRDELNPMAR